MCRFTKQDAFVGFQDDTPASVIFQATAHIQEDAYDTSIENNPDEWKENVFNRSCELLLQMASPDALIRLERSRLKGKQKELTKAYFFDQCHDSLIQFLDYHLHHDERSASGLLMQVSDLLLTVTCMAPGSNHMYSAILL